MRRHILLYIRFFAHQFGLRNQRGCYRLEVISNVLAALGHLAKGIGRLGNLLLKLGKRLFERDEFFIVDWKADGFLDSHL